VLPSDLASRARPLLPHLFPSDLAAPRACCGGSYVMATASRRATTPEEMTFNGTRRRHPRPQALCRLIGINALNWLCLYLPLIEAKLPQASGNAGPDGLGFAGVGFRALLAGLVPRPDLRVGARFTGPAAQAVRAALQEAADLIALRPPRPPR